MKTWRPLDTPPMTAAENRALDGSPPTAGSPSGNIMSSLDDRLKRAREMDPGNRGAFYYLSLLNEKRYDEAARRRELASRDTLVTSPPSRVGCTRCWE